MAQHLAAAYGRVGNVTYVGGQGDGVTSRVAQEVAGMVPLLGAVFESTTGLKLHDLIARATEPRADATTGSNGASDSAPRAVIAAPSDAATTDGAGVPESSVAPSSVVAVASMPGPISPNGTAAE